MNKTPHTYVFTHETLASAADAWVKLRSEKASEKEEAYLIVQAALPWFMLHLKQQGNICMFTNELMEKELDYWKADQLAGWPQQQTRIEETCDLIIDFFHSGVVADFKMIVVKPLSGLT